VAFLVNRTTFGRQLVAIGDNRAASALSGLPVRRVLVTVYVLSGVLAAIAGILLVGYGNYADPSNLGLNFELNAITAVVVGGTPLSGGKVRVLGTVAGAVLMQLITATLIQHDVKASIEQMVEAAIIVGAVYAARGGSGR
jgi:ribose transport system permease protein